MKRLPVIAIVGRPNVGKSSLFNRLIGKRIAIVENTPGITRDRIVHEVELNGYRTILVDTGGVDISKENLRKKVTEQAKEAIKEADIVILVVDGKEGINPLDEEVAKILRKWNKPVIVAVNKIDEPFMEDRVYEAYKLGFDKVIGISTIHKIGIEKLKEQIIELIPEELKEFSKTISRYETEAERAENLIESEKEISNIIEALEEGQEIPILSPGKEPIKVAIIGRPNMGKSTLFNAILGKERAIVSEIPGTTRDAIDSYVKIDGKEYVFIDTAGIRRRGKIKDIEYFSYLRSLDAIERADIVILLLDATEGVTERDTKVAGLALEKFKPLILVINKIDAVKDKASFEKVKKEIEMNFDFIPFSPVIFISAIKGEGIGDLLYWVDKLYEQFTKKVKTSEFNKLIKELMQIHQPPVYKGKTVKIFYGTQVKVKPPTFLLFSNYPEGIPKNFRRFLENRIRKEFGFENIPIRIVFKKR